MFRALRPVGEAAPAPSAATSWQLPDSFKLGWFGSGTSALAAVIQLEIARAGVGSAKIVLPAYTCPDVLSAIAFCGAIPVLVDIESSRPWLALDALRSAFEDDQIIAVVAIDFQGIPERLSALREITDQAGVSLIYDHCQGFPPDPADLSLCDYTVFSFGRGKPASALCGGAAVINRERLPDSDWPPVSVKRSAPSALKRVLYNTLIRPRVFWLPNSLPFLGLGETRYHELETIEGLSEPAIAAVQGAIASFQTNDIAPALAVYQHAIAPQLDLARLCESPPEKRLLRYCLLMPEHAQKESALARLSQHGLGASRLYPAPLNRLETVPTPLTRDGKYPAAADFSARLLTLPLHSDVTESDARKISRIISEEARL